MFRTILCSIAVMLSVGVFSIRAQETPVELDALEQEVLADLNAVMAAWFPLLPGKQAHISDAEFRQLAPFAAFYAGDLGWACDHEARLRVAAELEFELQRATGAETEFGAFEIVARGIAANTDWGKAHPAVAYASVEAALLLLGDPGDEEIALSVGQAVKLATGDIGSLSEDELFGVAGAMRLLSDETEDEALARIRALQVENPLEVDSAELTRRVIGIYELMIADPASEPGGGDSACEAMAALLSGGQETLARQGVTEELLAGDTPDVNGQLAQLEPGVLEIARVSYARSASLTSSNIQHLERRARDRAWFAVCGSGAPGTLEVLPTCYNGADLTCNRGGCCDKAVCDAKGTIDRACARHMATIERSLRDDGGTMAPLAGWSSPTPRLIRRSSAKETLAIWSCPKPDEN